MEKNSAGLWVGGDGEEAGYVCVCVWEARESATWLTGAGRVLGCASDREK